MVNDQFIKNNPMNTIAENRFLVAILLCSFNGARFLAEQLDSLESQTHQNWVLIVSDDGSTDRTKEILLKYKAKWSTEKLTIRKGPQRGFCMNFLSLASDPEIKADFYAFCDQDDVWMPEKLEIALKNITLNQQQNVPYLYCSRTIYTSENLKFCGHSPLFEHPPSFRNALVQSIGGGNTMVFNQTTKRIVESCGQLDVASHDWWIYLLVAGSGGTIFYDKVGRILYRQHSKTIVGGNNTIFAKLVRIIQLIKGQYKKRNSKNIAALLSVSSVLSESNKEILNLFSRIQSEGLASRVKLLKLCGLYRQTKAGTVSLYVAAFLNKL